MAGKPTNGSTRWPFGNEPALTRARRVALMYREALRANNRTLCDRLDRTVRDSGEEWVTVEEATVDGDGMDEVTTARAARLARVPEYEIRRWATLCACPAIDRPHPPAEHPGRPVEPLLPRFGRSGRSRTYLAGQVIAAARKVRGPVGLPAVGELA